MVIIYGLFVLKDESLGTLAPLWLSYNSVSRCMSCGVKFTFFKRRQYCQACGKVSLICPLLLKESVFVDILFHVHFTFGCS